MAPVLQDYLIDQSGVDWSSALSNWSWLVPEKFTLWIVTRFADMFLVLPDQTVHMLDVGAGTLTKVAEDRDEFVTKIDDDENATNWLMIPLVDQLVNAGIRLRTGECYAFKLPPVLGGQYSVDNCVPMDVTQYLGAYASIHRQLIGVPDGAEIVLKTDTRE